MIALSPKALRFAKMAAAGAEADDAAFFAMMISEVSDVTLDARGFLAVTGDDARLYVRCIADVLSDTARFEDGDLDGNDFAFLEDIRDDLEHQLAAKGSGHP